MSELAIDLNGVTKTYRGKVRALRDASLRVHKGEIFGLLGPNGAGKSTLVKILLTIVRPSSISGTMLGAKVGDRSTLGRIGYLPENPNFPGYLRGEEVLDVFGAMAKMPRRARKRKADELLDLVGMREWRRKRMQTYSKGMKQRIGLAQALMNDPELIFLDEPTDGVDPVGRREIRELLVELKRRGKTVVLNSHLLGEAEMVCDRVSILVQGQVRAGGTLDELALGKQRYEIELVVTDDQHASSFAGRALPGVLVERDGETHKGSLESGRWIEATRTMIRVEGTDPAAVQPILDALRRHDAVIRSIRPVRPSLEDLFIEAIIDPESGKATGVGAARGKRSKGGR
ncbi:MAG: ATP-binding cassette domain-containing protein [Phycisphaerales bacterium]